MPQVSGTSSHIQDGVNPQPVRELWQAHTSACHSQHGAAGASGGGAEGGSGCDRDGSRAGLGAKTAGSGTSAVRCDDSPAGGFRSAAGD